MQRNDPTPDNERPDHPAPPDMAPRTSFAAPGSGDLVYGRQLEKSVSWSGRERLRCLWYRLRLTVAEMNYAAQRIADPRVVELQAPLISDDRPSR